MLGASSGAGVGSVTGSSVGSTTLCSSGSTLGSGLASCSGATSATTVSSGATMMLASDSLRLPSGAIATRLRTCGNAITGTSNNAANVPSDRAFVCVTAAPSIRISTSYPPGAVPDTVANPSPSTRTTSKAGATIDGASGSAGTSSVTVDCSGSTGASVVVSSATVSGSPGAAASATSGLFVVTS